MSENTDLVKHIPVLAVVEGNPKSISGIADLGREDVVTVIGDPESTPIGKIAKKAFSDFGVTVQPATTTTTAPQLATILSVGEADAAIVWKENCRTEGVEICETTDLDPYCKTVPAARLTFGVENEAADVFSEFLTTQTVADIWAKFGYELVK